MSFILGIGLVVAGAAVAGLHYASTHGWDQPAHPRQAATEEPDIVETTAAQLAPTEPTSSLMMTFGENEADAGAAASAPPPPPPKPKAVWVPKPRPKSEAKTEAKADTKSEGKAETKSDAADPFATQQ